MKFWGINDFSREKLFLHVITKNGLFSRNVDIKKVMSEKWFLKETNDFPHVIPKNRNFLPFQIFQKNKLLFTCDHKIRPFPLKVNTIQVGKGKWAKSDFNKRNDFSHVLTKNSCFPLKVDIKEDMSENRFWKKMIYHTWS